MRRCINIDWLEVRAIESVPQGADFFRMQGYEVEERPYGTRVYAQMFTLYDNERPYLEIRRKPLSPILPEYSVHIRLCNYACYQSGIVSRFISFLQRYGYENVSVSRVDIALDFRKFDDGTEPQDFIRRYMDGRYSKVNQSNISAHGTDLWQGRVWNSLSWGSKASPIMTRLYCKTIELGGMSKGKKPYIVQSWLQAGLVTEDEVLTDSANIWRLEFEIKSPIKGWTRIKTASEFPQTYSMRNTLSCYIHREQLLVIFASLCNHYFHFKLFDPTKRKDRCQDRVLFRWRAQETIYKPLSDRAEDRPSDETQFLRDVLNIVSRYSLTQRGSKSAGARELVGELRRYIFTDLYPSALNPEDFSSSSINTNEVRELLHIHASIFPHIYTSNDSQLGEAESVQ